MSVEERVALDEEMNRWEREREEAWRGVCTVAKLKGKLRVLRAGMERRWRREEREEVERERREVERQRQVDLDLERQQEKERAIVVRVEEIMV